MLQRQHETDIIKHVSMNIKREIKDIIFETNTNDH